MNPPDKLSADSNHPDFHPSYSRVGVIIDGDERKDVLWYDKTRLQWRRVHYEYTTIVAKSIEPFWRFEESRQMRRARERWELKHGYVSVEKKISSVDRPPE